MPKKIPDRQQPRVCRYCGRTFSNESAAKEKGKRRSQQQAYCSQTCGDIARNRTPGKAGEPQPGLRLIRTEDSSLVEVHLDKDGLPLVHTLPEVSKVRWCLNRMIQVYGRIVGPEDLSPDRLPIPVSTHANVGKSKAKRVPIHVIPVEAQIAFTNLTLQGGRDAHRTDAEGRCNQDPTG